MTATPFNGAILILEVDGAGAHPAAWRLTGQAPGAALDIQQTAIAVLAAESAGFHAVSIDDSRRTQEHGTAARLDAVQRAAYVGPLTHSIGLIPVADSIFSEPFHLATQLAALDGVSGGRAGWLTSATGTTAEAVAVGREAVPVNELSAESADVLEVSRRLWDSWEDDAVIKDGATGRYLDRSKVHYADFVGGRFSIKGSAISPRPIQGQLPVLAPEGLALDAEATLFGAANPDALLAAAQTHRRPGISIAELEFILDHAGERAEDRLAILDSWQPWDSNAARFAGTAGEFSTYLVELLKVVDGVRLHPAEASKDTGEFTARVLPALRSAGVLKPIRTGNTLRETLGLPVAPNRFAAPQAQTNTRATTELEFSA